jgi:hypothetical protein
MKRLAFAAAAVAVIAYIVDNLIEVFRGYTDDEPDAAKVIAGIRQTAPGSVAMIDLDALIEDLRALARMAEEDAAKATDPVSAAYCDGVAEGLVKALVELDWQRGAES